MAEPDDLKGLTDFAHRVIRDIGRILDASPYGHADRPELRVRFWGTLVALTQGQHLEELLALANERGTATPTVRVDRAGQAFDRGHHRFHEVSRDNGKSEG